MKAELEASSSPGDAVVKLLDAQLGGFGTLSKLLLAIDGSPGKKKRKKKPTSPEHHVDAEVLPTCVGVLALQAKLSHESRVLITGIHNRHSQAKDANSMLRALAKLYSRSLIPGPEDEQLCRKCSREAVLYGACVSSTVFLTDPSRPPIRALLGQHFADSQWLELLSDCLRDESHGLSDDKAVWLSLSILANCTYDSRRARSALLCGAAFLAFLVKSVCRGKGLPPATKLRALCVVNNCVSPQPCLDDPSNNNHVSSSEAWTTVVSAVEGLISQASLVRYLYGLLTATAAASGGPSHQQLEGGGGQADEQAGAQAAVEEDCRAAAGSMAGEGSEAQQATAWREMGRILAAEGLLGCLLHCPSATLAVLKDRGAFLTFPALVTQQGLPGEGEEHKEGEGEGDAAVATRGGSVGRYAALMTQRFATAMLATVVDLLPRPSRDSSAASQRGAPQDGDEDDDLHSRSTRQPPGSQASSRPRRGSRGSAGTTKALQHLSRGPGGSVKGQHDTAQTASKPPFPSAEFVLILTQTGALVPLAWLLLHCDDKVQASTRRVWRYLVTQSSKVWVEPFIEQGGVPILFRCCQQLEGQSGISNESVSVAQQVLQALQAEVAAPEMLSQLVLRTMAITVHPTNRGNIAIAILLLSCGAPRIRESFVRSGGLHCILNMVHNPNTRESAVNFLAAVDSLVQQEPRPACWEVYVQDGDSELLFEEPGNRTRGDMPRAKGPGDLVFLVQNTEVNRRQTVIEMACPPAETLARASPVLQELLEEAQVTGQRPTVQGSYKVWEEIMSHIAQPWSFGRSMARYSPDLLVEMMTIAHRYGLWELKTVYGVRLSAYLDESSAVTLFHAALSVQHAWLSVEAYRVLLDSLDFVCSRSTRAVPLAVQLMEELLTNLLLS